MVAQALAGGDHILMMLLATDLAEPFGALGLSSMRSFSVLKLPYAIAAGAGLVEYRSGRASRATP